MDPVLTKQTPESQRRNFQILARGQSEHSPVYAIDPAGTKIRENAVRAKDGQLSVYVVLPPSSAHPSSPADILRFAVNTFRLSSALPLNERNARALAQQAIKTNVPCDCVRVDIDVKRPERFAVTLDVLQGCTSLSTTDYLMDRDGELDEYLRLFQANLPERNRQAYGCAHLQPFDYQFALLHTHAYQVVHEEMKRRGIPHFHHGNADQFRKIRFGVGGQTSEEVEKILLAAPLRKIAGFLNGHQVRRALDNGTSFFEPKQLAPLVEDINRFRGEKFTNERKLVLSAYARGVPPEPGRLWQKKESLERLPIVIDHLAHSAPFPKDAIRLLGSDMETRVKEAVLNHAKKNPLYAYELLACINGQKIFGKMLYRITESPPSALRSQESLTLELEKKDSASKKQFRKKLSIPLTHYPSDQHELRIKALQEIAGLLSDAKPSRLHIPHYMIWESMKPELKRYVGEALTPILKELGYSFEVKNVEHEGYVYRRISVTDSHQHTFVLETAPLRKGLKEADVYGDVDVINALAQLVERYECALPDPGKWLSGSEEIPPHSGFETVRISDPKKNNKTGEIVIQLSLPFRLLGQKDDKIRHAIALQLDLQRFASMSNAGDAIKNEIENAIAEKILGFITDVAQLLKLHDWADLSDREGAKKVL